MAIFSADEIKRRWQAVRQRLGEAECAVVPSFHNSYYLSGFPMVPWGKFSIVLLFRDDDPVLVTPGFEAPAAERDSPITDIRTYWDEEGLHLERAAALTADALRARHVRVVGIEADGMPTAMYHYLKSALHDSDFRDVTEAIDLVRLVSSEEELVYLREGCRLADVGMTTMMELLAPGVDETVICAEARLAMDKALRPDFQATTACYSQQGLQTLEPHLLVRRSPLQFGQIIEVVCECQVFYYQGANERAILLGECPPEAERAYAAMLEAFNACLDTVRAGATFADIYEVARQTLTDAGYPRLGPGPGLVRNIILYFYGRIEAGNFRPFNHTPLEPGMTPTIEPWSLVPGVGGPRHCEMVLVTEDGYERLTKTDAGALRILDP